MRSYRTSFARKLFTALELMVILVVLGIVANIVGPRMSRASATSPNVAEQILIGQLHCMRDAVKTYAESHGGRYPDGDAAQVVSQLTQFTDWSGNVSPVRTSRHWIGPSLSEMPALPVGVKRGQNHLARAGDADIAQAAWLYDPRSGHIWPATAPTEIDAQGKPYNLY